MIRAASEIIRNLVEIKDSSAEFLLRLDDGRVIDTKSWNDWEWTHGIGLYGIYKYYEQARDARCRQIMLDWFRDRFAVGPPTKNINTVAPFLTLACLHEESPNGEWLPHFDEWAECLMNGLPRTEENGFQHIVFNSENRQQLWDDTLMMSVLPLASIGKLLGRPHYVEEARRQFMVHVKYLVDRRTGDPAREFHSAAHRDPSTRPGSFGTARPRADNIDSKGSPCKVRSPATTSAALASAPARFVCMLSANCPATTAAPMR